MVKTREPNVIRLQSSIVIPNTLRGPDMPTYASVIQVNDLVSRFQIPYWDHNKKQGYQRRPDPKRVRKLARELKEGNVSVPTSLLLSVRDETLKPKLVGGFYELALPPAGEPIFYVVDGQHRLLALKQLVEEEPNGKCGDWRVSVVVFFGADESTEMSQFHIVNSNAKSIKTDLAYALIKERAQRHPDLMDSVISRRNLWKIQALELAEKLSTRGDWDGLIRFANQERGSTVITSNSFITSLKVAYRDSSFQPLDQKSRGEVLTAYWASIRRTLPECFHDPKKYALQKTVGVFVMHLVLPAVLNSVLLNGNSHNNVDAYEHMLRSTLENLTDENKLQEPVSGAEFWLTGRRGAAGRYSSGGAHAELAERIRQSLPRII